MMYRALLGSVIGGLVLMVAALAAPAAAAQAPVLLPTTNPAAELSQRIAATEIRVAYRRPAVKGREIFGSLVPYGQVWRTGADEATRISFSTPVTLGGAAVGAGEYELFTIPGEAEWVVILQAARGQWGSYRYDPLHDQARVRVPVERLSGRVESFTIAVDEIRLDAAVLTLAWDRVRVRVPITVDVRATAVPVVEAALAGEGRKPWFLAAMFYHEHNLDPARAAELIGRAVAEQPEHLGLVHRQALILERAGDLAGARAAARRSLALAQDAGPELRAEYTRLNRALLARLGAPPGL